MTKWDAASKKISFWSLYNKSIPRPHLPCFLVNAIYGGINVVV